MASVLRLVPPTIAAKPRVPAFAGLDAGAVHDLRGLLATVLLQAEALGAVAEGLPAGFGRLCSALERSVALCEATLEPGTPLRLTDVCLREAVCAVLADLTAGLYPERLFTLDVPPGLMVLADAARLHRILFNLLRNAASVSLRQGGGVRVEGGSCGDLCFVTVEDDGPGLPPHIRAALFKPAVSTGGGFGLGLVSADTAARAMGGRLSLRHTGHAGTAFQLDLPVAG